MLYTGSYIITKDTLRYSSLKKTFALHCVNVFKLEVVVYLA